MPDFTLGAGLTPAAERRELSGASWFRVRRSEGLFRDVETVSRWQRQKQRTC
jgi:hypothetical protein